MGADLGPAVLRTPRLRLRPLEVDDAEALWPLVSDPAFPRFMSWDAHADRAETRAWLADVIASNQTGDEQVWAIVPSPGDASAPPVASGVIGLHGVRRRFRAWRVDRAEVGYWLAPWLHGRGLMTEAARAVVAHAFAAADAGGLGLHKLTISCIADNDASRRVIEKLGFRFLCEHREHMFRFDRWWNQLSWEMTVDEHAALAARTA